MLLLVTMYIEKTSQKVKTDEILKACANYLYFALVLQLCACVMTLQSCYMRMYSFSANKKHLIFSCTLLIKLFIYTTYSDSIRVKLFVWIQRSLLSFVLIEEIIYVPQHFYKYLHIVYQLCQSLSILTTITGYNRNLMLWFFRWSKFVKFLYDVDCSFLYQFLYLHRFPIIYLYHQIRCTCQIEHSLVTSGIMFFLSENIFFTILSFRPLPSTGVQCCPCI